MAELVHVISTSTVLALSFGHLGREHSRRELDEMENPGFRQTPPMSMLNGVQVGVACLTSCMEGQIMTAL